MGAANLLSFARMTTWLSRNRDANALMRAYVKSGSERTFTALYKQYTDRLYYFILVLSDAELAADVCQKTWIKVIDKRHTYRDKQCFQAWLFTLARRTLIDELRKNSRLIYDSEDLINNTISPNSNVACLASGTDFHELLNALPFKQKEALSLQLDGFSLIDIAAICNTNVDTIKSRLKYARRNLQYLMERRHETQ